MEQELERFGEMLAGIPLKEPVFVNKYEVEQKILVKINSLKGKTVSFATYLRWSIAACLILAAGLTSWVKLSEVRYDSTGYMSIALPDGTKMNLSPNSSVSFNKALWLFKRDVSMTGRVHYAVSKGRPFTVETSMGDISVLGTVFNVDQINDNLNVECFEGQIMVKTVHGEYVLNKGEGIICSKEGINLVEMVSDEAIDAEAPGVTEDDFAPKEELLDNEPLINVVTHLEQMFGITVSPKSLCDGLFFTGGYPTDNLEEAAMIIFMSCDLDYEIKGKHISISKVE